MKKKLCAILAALLLLCCLPAGAAGADVTVTLGSVQGEGSQTVLVPVSLASGVNINSIGLTGFTYDKSVLTFNGFVSPGELVTAAALPSLDDDNATIVLGYMTAGKLSGSICALSFTLAADAPAGDYSITCTPVMKNGSTVISSVEVAAGKVSVSAGGGGGGTAPGEAYTLALHLMDKNGGALSAIPSQPFWASVSITKNAEADCGILLATYGAGGTFLDLRQANVRRLSVGESFDLDFFIPNEGGEVTGVTAFALTSLAQLVPLGAAVSLGR